MAKGLTIKEQYNNAIVEINTELGDILGAIRKDVDDYYKNHNSTDIHDVPSCGVLKRQPKYDPSDKALGETKIDQVLQEIKNDPIKWGDLQEISPDAFGIGSGRGEDSGRIPIGEIVYPKWISEIDSAAKLFFRRGKKKQYYDIESLSRGVPRKQKEKGRTRIQSLYVLLDVSGSMWGGSYKGIPLIGLMVMYFPPMARKFEGEIWQIDMGSPTVIIPLKQLRGNKLKDMAIAGGGGTDYNESFRLIADKKKMLEAEGKSPDFMTVVFTDGLVEWSEKLMPDNLLIVAPKTMERELPHDDAIKNRKAILIDVDIQDD